MKILRWIGSNLLFIFTIFLLAFIPLYPKIPLIDIKNTWVYVRAEDFVIVFVILVWIGLLIFKKVTLKTPLTIPIIFFWIIGGLTTLHGVLVLFPTLANVFSNVALLSYLRRIEYLSLFFIAYAGIKSKKAIQYAAVALSVILLLITGYGFGQKFLHFPAFLTMNEEFAKGVPIQLSSLSRVPSTFAGHYDLAAYLVLVIPMLVSLAFGFKNKIFKIFLFITASLGFGLLFMTVSRVSFFVLLLSLLMLLILQKKKIIIISFLALTSVLLIFSPSLLQRFGNTMSEVNVLVDAKTGSAIGEVRDVPAAYFKNKVIKKVPISNEDALKATDSATLPFKSIPAIVALVIEANSSTGESLPQGTSYVNLSLSPVIKKVHVYFFQRLSNKSGILSEEVRAFYGNYVIKRTKAYDLSFTTRFQGEWPRTFETFKRNIFLGGGYGSVSLAVDNNYLRILGESGLLGMIAFASIFIIAVIYVNKLLPKVDSPVTKSFVIGFIAGSFGLALNAFLIDVFEASKIAFTYWILMGIVIGSLQLYKTEKINFLKEFKKIITSPLAIIFYISVITAVFYHTILSNYFVGDDFIWFKWTSDSGNNIANYFTQANGFFYRPGTKMYFSLMYSVFWLNQTVYHLVSILLHLAVSVLLFLILRKILKNYLMSIVSVFLFVVLSGHHEDIFWISSTGFLFNAFFTLISLLSFIYYKEKGRIIYFIISVAAVALSLIFHEIGVIVPLLIILYDFIFGNKLIAGKLSRRASHFILLSPILPYLILRFISQSHWFGGDYNYNIFKLPYNFLGNTIGYLFLDLFGPQSLPFYEGLRNSLRSNMLIAIPLSLAVFVGFIIIYKIMMKKMDEKDRKIIAFGFLFFIIALLPFLGLGNIASRYSYLSSVGFVILLAFFLRKIYFYLINLSDRYIGTAMMVVIVTIYSMIQLFGLQKIDRDWQSAGEKTKRFLVSIEEHAEDEWMRDDMKFYFVNMPIRSGEAWVWPVGLKDALWLTFRNPKIQVYTAADVTSALDQVGGAMTAHVFKFNDDGSISEFIRNKSGQIDFLDSPK